MEDTTKKIKNIKEAKQNLVNLNANILGIILNKYNK